MSSPSGKPPEAPVFCIDESLGGTIVAAATQAGDVRLVYVAAAAAPD